MLYKQKLFGDYGPETQFLKTFGEMVQKHPFYRFPGTVRSKDSVCWGKGQLTGKPLIRSFKLRGII